MADLWSAMASFGEARVADDQEDSSEDVPRCIPEPADAEPRRGSVSVETQDSLQHTTSV